MHVGIDIEQFVRDPYASGIQRVLQYLALEWPAGDVQADFVIPVRGGHALLTPLQAGELLTLPFIPREAGSDLRGAVAGWIDGRLAAADVVRVKDGDLLALYDAWLLPEVSYLPSVLSRFELFSRAMPTVMIGYDALPMTEPANYRFAPGTNALVSEYFRHVATADSVVCISAWSRDSILGRLRRDPRLPISVAHPGGDHLPIRSSQPPQRATFVRLGTMEARKRPVEIADTFRVAVDEHGVDAELVFIGSPSASDEGINQAIRSHVEQGRVRWIQGATDAEVHDAVHQGSAFLSVGVEGYGIPVLEAIRLGTPVLYDGVQPAADLMQGRGARRIDAMTTAGLVDAFCTWAADGAVSDLCGELAPDAVPTWAEFARGVAQAVQV